MYNFFSTVSSGSGTVVFFYSRSKRQANRGDTNENSGPSVTAVDRNAPSARQKLTVLVMFLTFSKRRRRKYYMKSSPKKPENPQTFSSKCARSDSIARRVFLRLFPNIIDMYLNRGGEFEGGEFDGYPLI